MRGLHDLARGIDAQRFLLHALAAAAQYASFPRIDERRDAALEFPVDHVTQNLIPSSI
jgi:hypothetical protein